jgi:hypothetical protein
MLEEPKLTNSVAMVEFVIRIYFSKRDSFSTKGEYPPIDLYAIIVFWDPTGICESFQDCKRPIGPYTIIYVYLFKYLKIICTTFQCI